MKKEEQTGPHRVPDKDAFEEEPNKVIIYPRGFNITWGNDDRYWKKFNGEKKCEAELKQVSWLEVACSTSNKVEYRNTYKVGFIVSLKPDAFGWKDVDVFVMAKVGKSGKYRYKKVCLDKATPYEKLCIPDALQEPLKITVMPPTSNEPNDKPNDKPEPPEIHFGLYEVWNKKWKGGLKIHHAFLEKIQPDDPKNQESSSQPTNPQE